MFSFISQARLVCVTLVALVAFPILSAAPTAPTGLTAANVKATSFTLKWTAATGATGGIAGYDVARDGVLIGSTTTRSFAVTGLAPLSTYSLTVIARDGAGFVSPPSAVLAVATPADTTRPTRPTVLAASALTATSFLLNWTGSTDNVGVTGYNIYRAGALVASSPTETFHVSGLAPDKNHRMTVRAMDAAGNLSAASVALIVRTLALPPSVPVDLTATNLKATSFILKWSPSTGGTGGIAGYDVYRDDVLVGSVANRSFAITGLAPTTTYRLTVASRDTADHVSPPSAPLVVTTPPDTTRPTPPTGLNAASVTHQAFTLTWLASTDNVGVSSYEVYRNGALSGSTTGTTLGIAGLTSATTYTMKIKARDAAGNASAFSAALPVTSSALPNLAPAVTLTAPANGASFTIPVNLTLSAMATDTDGRIAKVEFYDHDLKLGETTSSTGAPAGTYAGSFVFATPGPRRLVARATDDRGATGDSTAVEIILLSGLPYLADFEATEGYNLGSLDNQSGWIVAGGTAQIVAGNAAHGDQSVRLEGGATVSLTGREFGNADSAPHVVFVDLWLKPVADADPAAGTTLDIDCARISFALDTSGDSETSPAGRFVFLGDDGLGGETWMALPPFYPLGAGHGTLDWQRLSLRLDYVARTWDVFLNGVLAASDLPFRTGSADFLTGVFFRGHAASDTELDDLYFGEDNPVFVDSDRDGMDDAWELSGGLDPSTDDRNADFDSDGLSNIQEFQLGTNPGALDTDLDGLPDLQEYFLGTDPASADSDADGLPDAWELNNGFDPRSETDAVLDLDGDGRSNLQEYTAGSDPGDYYNGILPQLISLVSADGRLGDSDTLGVLVVDAAGHPLPNAPVRFTAVMGGHRLAAASDESGGFTVTVNTDADGIARVFTKTQPYETP